MQLCLRQSLSRAFSSESGTQAESETSHLLPFLGPLRRVPDSVMHLDAGIVRCGAHGNEAQVNEDTRWENGRTLHLSCLLVTRLNTPPRCAAVSAAQETQDRGTDETAIRTGEQRNRVNQAVAQSRPAA